MGHQTFTQAASSGGQAQGFDQNDPDVVFRQVWEELGMKEAEAYVKLVQDEAGHALSQAGKGDYSQAWAFVRRRRMLLIGILLPLAVVLRWPALILGALR